MHFRDGMISALHSIGSHKLRSVLTTLGIVIGVMAVVTMFSSVYALKTLISKNMEGMGWNHSVIIIPAMNQFEPQNSTTNTMRRSKQQVPPLSLDDYSAIKNTLKFKSSYAIIESNSLLRKGNKDINVRIVATESSYFKNKNYDLSSGRYFDTIEQNEGMPVVIIGSTFASEHYQGKPALGEILVLGKHRLRIIGILGADKLNEGNNMDFNSWQRREDLKAIYVPLVYGTKNMVSGKNIHQIYLQASDAKDFTSLKSSARQLLLSRHNMYPNFSFMDIGAMMLTITDEIDKAMKKWNITLSAIASISLIVGGIGLFSTLLISIQERMTEIGIRKSIGATEADIFFYFIFEALALAMMGAAFGILIAWGLVSLMGHFLKFPLYLPWAGVSLGVFFAILIGFLSGLYPALKAASTDPIKAIYFHE